MNTEFIPSELFYEMFKQVGIAEKDFEFYAKKVAPIFQDRIMLKITEKLTNEQLWEIMNLFDQEKFEKLENILETFIPNLDDFVESVWQEFKSEWISKFQGK